MFTSRTGSWDGVRQSFADQFEQDRANFIYRRSQKGEAFRVSAEERSRFIDEFDTKLRRAKWIIYIGLTFALGGMVFLSVLRKSDLSQAVIFAAIGIAMIPYLAYFRWAWAAPARELAGRVPIAGERSPEEVRRLRFQRMTYGQLASAAFGGLVIPFIGSAHQDVFSGWNRLWLVFGGALMLFAAVQAFRKWRFDQEDSYGPSAFATRPPIGQAPDEADQRTQGQLWRYLVIGVILFGAAFVFFTPAGKAWVASPHFFPLLMIGCGAWALFTVARGFSKGRVEPFVRGFYEVYERETQPKRFWASITWNAFFGCLCFWLAYQTESDAASQTAHDRCYNEGRKYTPQEVLSACNQIIDKKVPLGDWSLADALLDRAIAYHRLHDYRHAIADDTEVLRLEPNYFEAYYNRALTYHDLRDPRRAIEDYTAAIRLRPNDVDAHFNRGFAYEQIGDLPRTVDDFSAVIQLTPNRPEAYYYRWAAYKDLGDEERAAADLAAIARYNPKLATELRKNP